MLDDDALTRFARQVVIPGLGVAGQEALLAARVLVIGGGAGAEAAALWLARAGVVVVRDDVHREAREDGRDDAFDVVVAVDAAALEDDERRRALGPGRPVCWYSIEDSAFVSGVHPEAPLPQGHEPRRDQGAEAHAAAAADVAGLATAIVAGLAHRREATRFEW